MSTSMPVRATDGRPARVHRPARSAATAIAVGWTETGFGGPNWVVDVPSAVVDVMVTRPGSCRRAPTVVTPTSVRPAPTASAIGTSLPSPFCRETVIPLGVSAWATERIASAVSNAFVITTIASREPTGSNAGSAVARGAAISVVPSGRSIRRPPAAIAAMWRRLRAMSVTSSPASVSIPANADPMAPAPSTPIRINGQP